MKKIIFILIAVILSSCTVLKNRNKTENSNITIYGKIWGTYGKEAGVVHTPGRYRIVNSKYKCENWPDSLRYQYVKVTGLLELNKNEPDTTNSERNINYFRYYIKNAQVELIHSDSIICRIDSALNRCVEMRRFFNRLQVDKILDSLGYSDKIIFYINDFMTWSTTTTGFFTHNGSKTIMLYKYLDNKISEYFKLDNLPCVKDSDYNVLLTLYRKEGGQTFKKEYHLTGNRNKINITEKEE